MLKITPKLKSFLGITLLVTMAATGWQSSARAETDGISQMIGSEEFLKMTADMMNSSLPMMLDEDTQWDSSYAGPGKMLTYNYTLVNYSASQIDGLMFANSIRSTLADIALRIYVRTFFESGINTFSNSLKFLNSLLHPIFENRPPTLYFV